MKKIIGTLLSLTMLIGTLPGIAVHADTTLLYSGGTGTAADPYIIENAADLKAVATNVNTSETATSGDEAYKKHYKLTTDIDLNNDDWTPIGLTKDKGFQGTFDGDGHVVRNFKITASQNGYVGLFGAVDSQTIKNLGVENATIDITDNTKQVYAGAMIGRGGGTVENCYVKNSSVEINSNYKPWVGAFTGSVRKTATYKNCYVIGCNLSAPQGSQYNSAFAAAIENYNEHNVDTFTNCYVANVTGAGGAFTYGNYKSATYDSYKPTLTNCYTTLTESSTDTHTFKGVDSATKDAIVAAMSASGEYTVSADKNDGWPYIETKSVSVWDGTVDTELSGGGYGK